jgi:perosamine synthetase
MTQVPHSRTVLAPADIESALDVLRSGEVNESEVTRELERAVASALGRSHAWATAGGTAAMYSALLCMGIGAGDDVMVPTYVCDDVLSAVLQSGARPVPVDLDPFDLNPDPADAAAKTGPRTRAIVLAHVLGMPARVSAFEAMGLPLIEDCAHGLGAQADGAPAGARGACTVLSFHGLKMVGAGEGGMVLTDQPSISEGYERLRHPDFAAGEYRLHSRLSNVLAAVALSQMLRLDRTVEHRRLLAERYCARLGELAHARPIPVSAADGRNSSCYRFAVVTDGSRAFDEVADAFAAGGVIVRRPVKQLCHRTLGMPREAYPAAEELFDRVVSLPLYPDLSEAEQDRVIAVAGSVLG